MGYKCIGSVVKVMIKNNGIGGVSIFINRKLQGSLSRRPFEVEPTARVIVLTSHWITILCVRDIHPIWVKYCGLAYYISGFVNFRELYLGLLHGNNKLDATIRLSL